MMLLRAYQNNGISEVARKIAQGRTKILFQLATGGGKTVTFSGLINRYLSKFNKKVIILVHRIELLEQARRTLFDWYGIIAQPILSGIKTLHDAPVYVGMVETVYNRLKKDPTTFSNVGMLIIDECHLGNFSKLHSFFPDAWIVGFTATPISANKNYPLNKFYSDIVCAIDIPQLITEGSLCPNVTYYIKYNVNRNELKVAKGDFNESHMGRIFSNKKQINNVIYGYQKYCAGTKAVVFNCSVEHSILVNDAFLKAGIPSRHLDSNSGSEYRRDCLKWLKSTPGAVLQNVGILTTGFDEPSIQSVIVNKSTMSLNQWLQMTGRGARPNQGKERFTILDLGDNAISHGDWSTPRNWREIFYNPPAPSKGGGVAPIKECSTCEALIPAGANICPICNADMKKAIQVEDRHAEFERFTRSHVSDISTSEILKQGEGRKSFNPLHKIKKSITYTVKFKWQVNVITPTLSEQIRDMYQDKVKEWCAATGEGYTKYYRQLTDNWMIDELKKSFTWQQ